MANYKTGVGTTGAQDNHFSQTVQNDIQKSRFNRDQVIKTSFNAGDIVPLYVDEVLPGDTHEIDLGMIARMTTPIVPVMDDVDLDFYAFFVPNRIVFDKWAELNGENHRSPWVPIPKLQDLVPVLELPTDVGDYSIPIGSGSIADYYGIVPGIVPPHFNSLKLNALPIRGYYSIYNRWFRDQNLQAPIAFLTNSSATENSGTINFADKSGILQANKKHDYFTSALPGTAKGWSPGSTVNAPKFLINTLPFKDLSGGVANTNTAAGIAENVMLNSYNIGSHYNNVDDINILQALRNAAQLNKLLERDVRGGTRYVEMLKAHFNVDAQDYRLQYPEFLGHFGTKINISQVPQTSSTDDTSPQGNLAAFGMTATHSGKFIRKSFVEHGFIHIMVVARQRKTYQQGIERFWQRRERFDYYYPEFAHITEQPILAQEIYAGSELFSDNKIDTIFGYQEAWADYRYKPNRVSGQLRSGVAGSQSMWHYADYYTSSVWLVDNFIKDNSKVNIDRTLSVPSSSKDQFILDCKIYNKTTRPMPLYSIPGMLDHF